MCEVPIQWHCDENLPRVCVDLLAIEDVFIRLISNAIEALSVADRRAFTGQFDWKTAISQLYRRRPSRLGASGGAWQLFLFQLFDAFADIVSKDEVQKRPLLITKVSSLSDTGHGVIALGCLRH